MSSGQDRGGGLDGSDFDELIETPARIGRSMIRTPRLTLSLSAFVMSLAITLINAFYALQGAEIVVLPPQQVLLFRDGDGKFSTLDVALPVSMINTAGDYGDVVLSIDASIGRDAKFAMQEQVTPVFLGQASPNGTTAAECPVDARCVRLPGLQLVSYANPIADLPAGEARARTFTFPLSADNCKGSGCRAFADFAAAGAQVAGKPLKISFKARFNSDGVRTITCETAAPDANYVAKVGWTSLHCRKASVTDPGWF